MKEDSVNSFEGIIRTIYYSNEFSEFHDTLNEKTKKKIDYVIALIKDMKLIHTDFVKKLVNTELYEMRVSVGTNEYRTIIFSIDHENIIEATEVVLLNGFLKKSTKDYDKQIKKAETILNSLDHEND
ncbi:type II toxin-antitoxin system RelE/ParE family toxin [Dysgonomonas sp.]